MFVAHLLRHITSEGAAEPATAVHNQLLVVVREFGPDISLEDTLAKMYGIHCVPLGPLAVFPDIHEHSLVILLQVVSSLLHCHFLDACA